MVDIKISNLSVVINQKTLLNNINMNINSGDSLVIIGGSGSGKSVLIKTISGFIREIEGSILIDGVETADINEEKFSNFFEKISFLFQDNALFDSLPIWKNVGFQMIYNKKNKNKDIKEKVEHFLKIVGLENSIMNLFPSEISGGMQKRVAIARALTTNPKIIFFDEPTSGLDAINTDLINDLIIRCNKELGITTVTITHDLNSAFKISDPKVAVIYSGDLIFYDNKEKLLYSDNDYVKKIISFSSIKNQY